MRRVQYLLYALCLVCCSLAVFAPQALAQDEPVQAVTRDPALVAGQAASAFDYAAPTAPTVSRQVEETAQYQKFLVQFPSALVTKYSTTTTISAMYYVPTGHASFPVVVVLPHLSGGMRIERHLTHGLIRAGIGVLHITEPYYFTFNNRHDSWLANARDLDDLIEVVHLLRQAVINARQGLDWVLEQPGVDRDRVGLVGISMGGWIGVLVSGIDQRVSSSVYVLAGGDLSQLLSKSTLTGELRNNFRAHGVSMDDVRVVTTLVDPLMLAKAARRSQTLMINATFDRTVPRICTDRLWEALGRPMIYWLPSDHATANLFRWYIRQKTVQHFVQMFLHE